MAYTIHPSADGNYIVLKVTGDISRELAMQYDIEAHKLGDELGINRYLMDMTESRNVDSVMESYKFAYDDLPETSTIDKSACVALLVSPNDHSHDFIETVTRNIGLNVTLFRDRDEAVNHLLENKQ
ncbi:hypothetical protein ACFL4L_03645 [bacterium]